MVGGWARSVGLYAAASAKALGAERVVYADADPGRLERAAALGAEPVSVHDGEDGALSGHGGRVRGPRRLARRAALHRCGRHVHQRRDLLRAGLGDRVTSGISARAWQHAARRRPPRWSASTKRKPHSPTHPPSSSSCPDPAASPALPLAQQRGSRRPVPFARKRTPHRVARRRRRAHRSRLSPNDRASATRGRASPGRAPRRGARPARPRRARRRAPGRAP